MAGKRATVEHLPGGKQPVLVLLTYMQDKLDRTKLFFFLILNQYRLNSSITEWEVSQCVRYLQPFK